MDMKCTCWSALGKAHCLYQCAGKATQRNIPWTRDTCKCQLLTRDTATLLAGTQKAHITMQQPAGLDYLGCSLLYDTAVVQPTSGSHGLSCAAHSQALMGYIARSPGPGLQCADTQSKQRRLLNLQDLAMQVSLNFPAPLIPLTARR